jgi:hypothetical protein
MGNAKPMNKCRWVAELAKHKTDTERGDNGAPASELDTDDAIARATELLQQHASSPVMRNAQGKQTNGPAIEGDHGDDWTVRVANNVGDLGISCETCFELMRDHFNDACVPVWPLEGSKSLRQRREGIELGNPRYTGHPCRHRGHGAERYTVCGGCVACARVGAERRRLERGAKVRGPMPQARHQCRSERRAAARSRRAEEMWSG